MAGSVCMSLLRKRRLIRYGPQMTSALWVIRWRCFNPSLPSVFRKIPWPALMNLWKRCWIMWDVAFMCVIKQTGNFFLSTTICVKCSRKRLRKENWIRFSDSWESREKKRVPMNSIILNDPPGIISIIPVWPGWMEEKYISVLYMILQIKRNIRERLNSRHIQIFWRVCLTECAVSVIWQEWLIQPKMKEPGVLFYIWTWMILSISMMVWDISMEMYCCGPLPIVYRELRGLQIPATEWVEMNLSLWFHQAAMMNVTGSLRRYMTYFPNHGFWRIRTITVPWVWV